MQGDGRGSELKNGGNIPARMARSSLIPYNHMHCQSSRNDRNENDAREVYGDYIIDNAKAEPIGNTDVAKFNCEANADPNNDYAARSREPCCKSTIYFEGAPKNNSIDEMKIIVTNKIDGVEIIMTDEEHRITPGYVDFTDSKQLIGDTEMKSDGKKILKITDCVVQQVYHDDLMYRFQLDNGAQYSQLRSKANLS